MNSEKTAGPMTDQTHPTSRIKLPDIKPKTEIAALRREGYKDLDIEFPIKAVSIAVGMNATFIRKVIGKKTNLTPQDVIELLDQDSYAETIVPRSRVIDYLLEKNRSPHTRPPTDATIHWTHTPKGPCSRPPRRSTSRERAVRGHLNPILGYTDLRQPAPSALGGRRTKPCTAMNKHRKVSCGIPPNA